MITYLFNFVLCSGTLLLTYHFLLKNKSMYNFSRAFLLLSVLFSLTVPLITVNRDMVATLPSIKPVEAQLLINNITEEQNPAQTTSITHHKIDYLFYSCICVYIVVTLSLLIRFIQNLYAISLMVNNNERVAHNNVSLVLIEPRLTPHTFFKYIFLNKDDYFKGQIEDEILSHEYAHASQFHSLDIILIEIIQVFCWFNPLIFFYRKAIQLNHEFIADAAVLKVNSNLNGYQNLLISQLGQFKSYNITSQFNYSITKKRLLMMTKTTSAKTAWLTRFLIIPVLAATFTMFCNKTDARQNALTVPGKSQADTLVKIEKIKFDKSSKNGFQKFPSTQGGVSKKEINEYLAIEAKYGITDPPTKGMPKKISNADHDRLEELFKQMIHKQQGRQIIGFMYSPAPLPPGKPTQTQLDLWKNSAKYGVWVNDKRIKNIELGNFKPDDFGEVFISRLTKIAVANDKFYYQIDLMTADFYKTYLKNELDNRFKPLLYYRYSKVGTVKS